MIRHLSIVCALAASVLPHAVVAQRYDERPEKLQPVEDAEADFFRRTIDIPMRDGVKLHTVILVPKGAKDAGILLTRTPYNADALTNHAASGKLASVLGGDAASALSGYATRRT